MTPSGTGFANRVSIVIPAYNEAAVLPRCLDSVLAQTYDNLEIILVDDGSTDHTDEILRSYAKRDSRIKVIRQDNAGAGAARNAGLAVASGEFVQFVDADDRIPPAFTSALMEAIGDANLAVCGFRMLLMEGENIIREDVSSPPVTGKMSVGDYLRIYSKIDDRVGALIMYSQCNKLFRLSCIRDAGLSYHTDMTCWEDGHFNLEYLALCNTVAVTGEVYYEYLIGSGVGQEAGGNVLRSRGVYDLLRVGRFFRDHFKNVLTQEEMNLRLGIFANYMIILIINMSRRDTFCTRKQVVATLRTLINSPDVRTWFSHYRAKPGQSQLIPLLVKWRLPTALFVLARIRAEKRYRKYFLPQAETRRGLAWFS